MQVAGRRATCANVHVLLVGALSLYDMLVRNMMQRTESTNTGALFLLQRTTCLSCYAVALPEMLHIRSQMMKNHPRLRICGVR